LLFVSDHPARFGAGGEPPNRLEDVDPERSARLLVEPYESVLTYSTSGHTGSAHGTVEPPRAGPYIVRTVGDPGPGEWNVAFGSSIARPLVRSFLGAFAIGGVLGLAGVILFVATAIRRSRAGRAPVAPLEPGASGNRGPLGQPRGIGFGILMYILTFGIYSLYWVFKTQEETKRHTGEGLGGVVGLVVWLLVSPVTAFVIPSEIGAMYRRAGREPPLTGWTGLWLFPGAILIAPAIVWFVLVQGALNRYWEAADRVVL
jgi:hypothetical protein